MSRSSRKNAARKMGRPGLFFSGRKFIALFAVLGYVEAFDLVLARDAQTDGEIDKLEEDEGSGDEDGPGDGDSDELVEKLMPVAFDDA
jgi:hypothetical protein